MKCEQSFITIKLIRHSYLILSLSICAHKTLLRLTLNEFSVKMGKRIRAFQFLRSNRLARGVFEYLDAQLRDATVF